VFGMQIQAKCFVVRRSGEPSCAQVIQERSFEAAAVAYLEHEHVEGAMVDLVVVAEDGARQAFTLQLY
jgi:hypothetical protein